MDIERPTDMNNEDLFHELNSITFYQRFQYGRAIIVYKCINNMASEKLNYIFVTVNTLHSRTTRQSVHDDLFY